MPDVGNHTPDEVSRAKQKFLAISRTKWRLKQRLETIDYEHDVIKPQLEAFETKVVSIGELPEFTIDIDG